MNKSLLALTSAFSLALVLAGANSVFAADSNNGNEVVPNTAEQKSQVVENGDAKEKANDEILKEAEKQAEKEKSQKPTSMQSLKSLVDNGEFEKAYAQGQEMLFDYEGEPEFDLLYGTAAVEMGENKEALFIFERLVESDPSNLRYQLELGRVHYQKGDKEQAKSIFENVLVSGQELPDNVEARIMAYLNAISAGSDFGDPAKAETLKAFIGIAIGNDSNANGASDVNTIARYFGFEGVGGEPVQFPNPDVESSTYLAHQVAVAYVKPLNERTAIDFKIYGANLNNSNDKAVDNGSAFFEMGNRWRFDKGLAYFSLRATGVKQNHNDLYDAKTFGANWTQPVEWQFADSLDLGFSTGTVRYTSDSSKDLNTTNFDVGITKQVDKFIHAGGIQYGIDDAQGSQDFIDPVDGDKIENLPSDQYSRNYYGLSYSLSYLYDSKTTFNGGLLYQKSSYEEEDHDYVEVDIVSGKLVGEFTKRDGDMKALVLGARHNWNKNLQFRGSITVMDVTSKIKFYEYSRNKIEVGAGYQL